MLPGTLRNVVSLANVDLETDATFSFPTTSNYVYGREIELVGDPFCSLILGQGAVRTFEQLSKVFGVLDSANIGSRETVHGDSSLNAFAG